MPLDYRLAVAPVAPRTGYVLFPVPILSSLKDLCLVASSSSRRISLGDITTPLVAFLLDPCELLLAVATFAHMLV